MVEGDHVSIFVTAPGNPSFDKNVILFFSPPGQNTMYEGYSSGETSLK